MGYEMSMKTSILAALAVATMVSHVAVADDAYFFSDAAELIFTRVDANEDGMMTMTEHDQAGLGRWGSTFSDLDLTGDGLVSRDEYRIFFEMRHNPGRSA
jgi:hypothetical protein